MQPTIYNEWETCPNCKQYENRYFRKMGMSGKCPVCGKNTGKYIATWVYNDRNQSIDCGLRFEKFPRDFCGEIETHFRNEFKEFECKRYADVYACPIRRESWDLCRSCKHHGKPTADGRIRFQEMAKLGIISGQTYNDYMKIKVCPSCGIGIMHYGKCSACRNGHFSPDGDF